MSATTKVVTGKVRFSYANVWEPRAMEGSDRAKYSVSILIPKSGSGQGGHRHGSQRRHRQIGWQDSPHVEEPPP